MSTTEESSAQHLNRISIKIPPFWPADPELWFAQIETQFILAGVTADDTKFFYVCGNIEPKYAAEVRDILTNPPAVGKYEKLKTELIKRLGSSQEQKLRRLLSHEEMGDRTPSLFLRHLRTLAGSTVPDAVLKSLWLTRLPSSVQAILATHKSAELDSLADMADSVWEVNHPQILEASQPINSMMTQLMDMVSTKMENMVQTFQQDISAIKEDLRNHRSKRSVSPFNPRRPSSPHRPYRSSPTFHRSGNQNSCGDVCWYHLRFGDAADRCTRPCNFRSKSSGNGLGSH
jgi:hypothetical protein